MQEPTTDFVRALAAANGLTIPEERLALVREQYASFMRVLAEIATLPLPRETEPALAPVVPVAPVESAAGKDR